MRWGFEAPERDLKRAYRGLFTYVQWRRLSRDLGFPLRPEPSELGLDQWLGLFRFLARGKMSRRLLR